MAKQQDVVVNLRLTPPPEEMVGEKKMRIGTGKLEIVENLTAPNANRQSDFDVSTHKGYDEVWLNFKVGSFPGEGQAYRPDEDWLALVTFAQVSGENSGELITSGGLQRMFIPAVVVGGKTHRPPVQVVMISGRRSSGGGSPQSNCRLQINPALWEQNIAYRFTVTWLDFDENHAFLAHDDPCMKIGSANCP